MTVTVSETRDRNIDITEITNEQLVRWITDGMVADYGAAGTGELPADFALDADDTLTLHQSTSATPLLVRKGDTFGYELHINETD